MNYVKFKQQLASTLSLTCGWCGMTPEFQINEHTKKFTIFLQFYLQG